MLKYINIDYNNKKVCILTKDIVINIINYHLKNNQFRLLWETSVIFLQNKYKTWIEEVYACLCLKTGRLLFLEDAEYMFYTEIKNKIIAVPFLAMKNTWYETWLSPAEYFIDKDYKDKYNMLKIKEKYLKNMLGLKYLGWHIKEFLSSYTIDDAELVLDYKQKLNKLY